MTHVAQRDRLPPRALPLLYFGFAHLCLGAAFLFLALQSEALVGFFYHPQMIAVVHLVTLWWITGSILGAIYLVGPIALRMQMPARRLDYLAFILFALGVTGTVGHFWIDSYSGMLGSAGILLLGVAWVAGRVLAALGSAALSKPVKLHIGFAFLNILTAGAFGFLVGLEKLQVHVLPGFVLDSVYAHAHLAALGWATMIVVGIGYRLFPMFLSAAMHSGPGVWASAVLLEAGALGLFFSLRYGSRSTVLWALVAVSGLFVFFWHVRWMSRHPRSAPKDLQRPDFGMGHALAAIGYLAGSTVLGMVTVRGFSADGFLIACASSRISRDQSNDAALLRNDTRRQVSIPAMKNTSRVHQLAEKRAPAGGLVHGSDQPQQELLVPCSRVLLQSPAEGLVYNLLVFAQSGCVVFTVGHSRS